MRNATTPHHGLVRLGIVVWLVIGLLSVTASTAAAESLEDWTCSVTLSAADAYSADGTAACVDHENQTLPALNASVTFDDVQGSLCGTGAPYKAGGSLRIYSGAAGIDAIDSVTVASEPGGRTGTIEFASGSVGRVTFDEVEGSAAKCLNGEEVFWVKATASFVPSAEASYGKADPLLTTLNTLPSILTPDPLGPHTQGLADTLEEGINVVRGAKDETGDCVFDMELTLTSESSEATTEEVGFDPSRCLLDVAVKLSGAIPTVGQDQAVGTSGDPIDPCLISLDTACGRYKRIGWRWEVWHNDPASLQVAKHIQEMAWDYGNGCVHNPVTLNTWDRYLEDTTWYLKSKNTYADATCQHTYLTSYRHYVNSYFCGGTRTNVEHDRQLIFGHPNGDVTGRIQYKKSGVCRDMLTMKNKLTRFI